MSCVSSSVRSTTPTDNHHNRNFWRTRWYWSDANYQELVTMYMNFVDKEESINGISPLNPHLNPILIKQAVSKFLHIAPHDCIVRKLKDCYELEEEPYHLCMDGMYDTTPEPQINIRHRIQWNTAKVERMKDQLALYTFKLSLTTDKQTIRTLNEKIKERENCLPLHPTRYYRPGP